MMVQVVPCTRMMGCEGEWELKLFVLCPQGFICLEKRFPLTNFYKVTVSQQAMLPSEGTPISNPLKASCELVCLDHTAPNTAKKPNMKATVPSSSLKSAILMDSSEMSAFGKLLMETGVDTEK